MKAVKMILVAALAVIFSANAFAGDWRPLFCCDLSNAQYKEGVWTKDADGVLTASEDDSIWLPGEFENFELSLEFKNDYHTNSGVLIYCTDIPNWIPNALEVQILDDSDLIKAGGKPENHCCGAIYGHVAPTKLVVKDPGEWNTMLVRCVGPIVEVTLNGEKITEMDMRLWTQKDKNPDGSGVPGHLGGPKCEAATKGAVGFQGKHGAASIYFRNVMIRDAE